MRIDNEASTTEPNLGSLRRYLAVTRHCEKVDIGVLGKNFKTTVAEQIDLESTKLRRCGYTKEQ